MIIDERDSAARGPSRLPDDSTSEPDAADIQPGDNCNAAGQLQGDSDGRPDDASRPPDDLADYDSEFRSGDSGEATDDGEGPCCSTNPWLGFESRSRSCRAGSDRTEVLNNPRDSIPPEVSVAMSNMDRDFDAMAADFPRSVPHETSGKEFNVVDRFDSCPTFEAADELCLKDLYAAISPRHYSFYRLKIHRNLLVSFQRSSRDEISSVLLTIRPSFASDLCANVIVNRPLERGAVPFSDDAFKSLKGGPLEIVQYWADVLVKLLGFGRDPQPPDKSDRAS